MARSILEPAVPLYLSGSLRGHSLISSSLLDKNGTTARVILQGPRRFYLFRKSRQPSGILLLVSVPEQKEIQEEYDITVDDIRAALEFASQLVDGGNQPSRAL